MTSTSQDEQLSAADVDGDGDLDLVLGTIWLRNEGRGNWTPLRLREPPGKPDRHHVADLNGDGRLDVVVGFEAINLPGQVAWYEHGADPARPWVEHVIANLVGPMSLDVADVDRDGDLDIVVGEHNLRHPSTSRLVWLENVQGDASFWAIHVIHVGDEHHDGALIVDIDNDGDLDIVSIGWGHDRLLIYENLSIDRH